MKNKDLEKLADALALVGFEIVEFAVVPKKTVNDSGTWLQHPDAGAVHLKIKPEASE